MSEEKDQWGYTPLKPRDFKYDDDEKILGMIETYTVWMVEGDATNMSMSLRGDYLREAKRRGLIK